MPKSTSLGVGKIGVDLKREKHGSAKISNQNHVSFSKTMNQMVGYIEIFVPFVWHRESNLVIRKKNCQNKNHQAKNETPAAHH